MAQVCQKHIDILNVCCRKFHNITLQPITFDPQDYAYTMQHLVFELSQSWFLWPKRFLLQLLKTALQPSCLPATDEPQPETSTNVIEVRGNTVPEASTSTGLEEARPSQPPMTALNNPGSRLQKSPVGKNCLLKSLQKSGYITKRGSALCVAKRWLT